MLSASVPSGARTRPSSSSSSSSRLPSILSSAGPSNRIPFSSLCGAPPARAGAALLLPSVAMKSGAARTDFGERASGDVHPAAAVAGFGFYNVRRQNAEVHGRNWERSLQKLLVDLAKIFLDTENKIHVLCISEFGSMEDNIDYELKVGAEGGRTHRLQRDDGKVERVKCQDTKSFFQAILRVMGLSTIEVVAHPPYVTLVDTDWWRIVEAMKQYKMCSHDKHFVQHLLLSSGPAQFAETSGSPSGATQPAVVRVFNVHMPTSMATPLRKKDCLLTMGIRCSEQDAWIIGGDLNMNLALAMNSLRQFLSKEDEDHISKSNHHLTDNAQKEDWACSSGIDLVHVKSWVGIHSQPCFSDVHDMVVVIGQIQVKRSGASQPAVAERQSASSSNDVSNVVGSSSLGSSSSNRVWVSAAESIAKPTREYRPPNWFPPLVAVNASESSAGSHATRSASMAETATRSHVQQSSAAVVDLGAVQPSVAAKLDESPVKVSSLSQPAVADQTGTVHVHPSMHRYVLNELGERAAGADEAAEDVLAAVTLGNHGRRVKSDEEIKKSLGVIFARRARYIRGLAEKKALQNLRIISTQCYNGSNG